MISQKSKRRPVNFNIFFLDTLLEKRLYVLIKVSKALPLSFQLHVYRCVERRLLYTPYRPKDPALAIEINRKLRVFDPKFEVGGRMIPIYLKPH